MPYLPVRSTLGPSSDPTDYPEWIKEVVSAHSSEQEYIDAAPTVHDEYEYDPVMLQMKKRKARHF